MSFFRRTPSSPVGGNNANRLNQMGNKIEAENVDEQGTSSHREQRLVLGSSGAQEPEREKCGTTHYTGCACHEQGWENKWKCAVEMAARAEARLDAVHKLSVSALQTSWLYSGKEHVEKLMREIAAISSENAGSVAVGRERHDAEAGNSTPT